jgi:hypothetical protein
MAIWEVEVTDVFEQWWNTLNEAEREDVRAAGIAWAHSSIPAFVSDRDVPTRAHART